MTNHSKLLLLLFIGAAEVLVNAVKDIPIHRGKIFAPFSVIVGGR
jgi:hypothetical protein